MSAITKLKAGSRRATLRQLIWQVTS